MSAFINGDGVILDVDGPGKVHLLSYGSNANITNHVGAISTRITSAGIVTRFIISHSYTFTRFAFYWEGTGAGVCGIGQGLERTPVGKSWSDATMISYGGTSFSRGDVSKEAASAVQRDGEVTCFIIPDRPL